MDRFWTTRGGPEVAADIAPQRKNEMALDVALKAP
jgi:hypothetical protein